MKISEMSNLRLIKELEYTERQINNLLSTKKQIREELAKRYDKGELEENDNGTNKKEIEE